MSELDLLNPTDLREHYVHQLKQTIHAYSHTQVVLGEALQNAIDAVVESGGGHHTIALHLDFDHRKVTVKDDGVGFPNDPSLLFLGGSRKRAGRKNIFGLVGVGLKVVLFRSDAFSLRSRTGDGAHFHELRDAYRFDAESPPSLRVPETFPADPSPLESSGTVLQYSFPAGTSMDPLRGFCDELRSACLPETGPGVAGLLQRAKDRGVFETRFAALVALYLRRFTYAGDVLNRLGDKQDLNDTTIQVTLRCDDPVAALGEALGELWDGKKECGVGVEPTYLLVEDTVGWVGAPKPGAFNDQLGPGGKGLSRTANGYNQVLYSGSEDYEKLLLDTRRRHVGPIARYRERLFPSINGIVLTIGRIPMFAEYLPGGSQRLISANGVRTTHDIDLTSGRNQEYVRCFDLVIDVDAELNYGKSQLKNNQLVGLVRQFVNDAYRATIQNAAGTFVGRIDADEPEYDEFLAREDLRLPGFAFQKVPRDENDVIALFFELLGRGTLKDFQFLGLSQMDPYDARALIRRAGEGAVRPMPPDDRQLDVVEFKVRAASLVADLEREAKLAKDIHLLVAWEEGTHSSQRFAFADIEHSKFHPDRVVPGARRYLDDTRSGAQVQVLLLTDIIQPLRSPPSSSSAPT